MATVVKNFRIKSGLIVEGTTATIGGQNILTETGGDAYILNLVGGATLVKSVGSNLSVDGAGELSLDLVGIVEDIAGTRLTTDGSTLNVDVDGIADDLTGSYDFATNFDVSMAISSEATFRDAAIAIAKGEAQDYADGLASNYDAAGSAAAAQTAAQTYADGLAVNYDAAGSAATAEQNAKDYADNKINDASNLSTEVWSAYKTGTEISVAQTAAQEYADDAVAALVGSAPELLDTIQELATALGNNPDIIADLQDVAAGKQNTLTAGSNIDITSDVISVTGLDSQDISDFASAAWTAVSVDVGNAQLAAQDYADGLASNYDAAGSAAAAQTAAQDYADGLASNYDAAGSAAAAQTAAEGYADGLVDNLVDGTTPFTAINVNDVAKQVAATTGNIVTAAATTAYSWTAADFRSAKFVVKAKNGVHTQVSDLVVTLDTSNNVAVSEYGITYSNGTELAAVTADYSGTDVRIRVTPANDNTEVIVVGTLIK
jgi:hypothetical protein